MAGVPITPGYILSQQFWASGVWVHSPQLRELMLRPLDYAIEFGRYEVENIRRQLDQIMAWQRRDLAAMQEGAAGLAGLMREGVSELIAGGVWVGREQGRLGFERRGVMVPQVGQFAPTIPVAPTAPVPVRLRVDLDKSEITLKVRVVTPEGREILVPRTVKITPVEEAARENPPTAGS